MIPKFLVCTMWSGEPDYNKCIQAINSQKDVQIDLKVFSFMLEMEAHNKVYSAFNEADPTLFRAKIDADVVLIDDHVLSRIADHLSSHTMTHGIAGRVHDYMTDNELSAGVAFYTSKVRFDVQHHPLLCDRNVIFQEHKLFLGGDVGIIGHHMYHCNELTAFRYGFHRGLKHQVGIYNQVKRAHAKHLDDKRLMAMKGFEAGLSGDYDDVVGHNYGDDILMKLFRENLATIRA